MKPDQKDILSEIHNWEKPESPDCHSCLDMLSAYIDSELAGENPADLYPAVANHLADCRSCRQEYDELRQLLRLEQEGDLARPPIQPAFDFSYLEKGRPAEDLRAMPVPESTWVAHTMEWGKAWIEVESGRWQRLLVSLAKLGKPTETSPALTGLMSSENEDSPAPPGPKLHISPENLEVDVSVLPDPADERLCQLEVAILNDRSPLGDFSGIAVTLYGEDMQQTGMTNEFGEIRFTALARDQLTSLALLIDLPD